MFSDQEGNALTWALQHFGVYVGSGPVVGFTDHNPLTFLNSFLAILFASLHLFYVMHRYTCKALALNEALDIQTCLALSMTPTFGRQVNSSVRLTCTDVD